MGKYINVSGICFSCSSFLLLWGVFSAWNPVAVTVTSWANQQGRAFMSLHSAWSWELFWWELWVGRRGELSLGGHSGFQKKLYLPGTRGSQWLHSLDNWDTFLGPNQRSSGGRNNNRHRVASHQSIKGRGKASTKFLEIITQELWGIITRLDKVLCSLL